jgi:dephospho-CoA kinase
MSAGTDPAARPLRVVLTGGIASGKSTVAAQLASFGVPVLDLDQVARDVVAPGTPLLARVCERFGAQLLLPDGSLDRRALREIVFRDAQARADLEALLHPAILAAADAWHEHAGGPYQVVVNPLLGEMGVAGRYHRVVVVDCDPRTQRERLLRRDGASPELADAILASQADRATRLALATEVIDNSGDPDRLPEQVRALHRRLAAAADGLRAASA